MDCRQIIKIYQMYVDEEMDTRERRSLKSHIEDCPHCKVRIKFEVQFQTTITKKLQSRSAPSELKERIKNHLF